MFSRVPIPLALGMRSDLTELASQEESLSTLFDGDLTTAGQVRAREAEVEVVAPIVSRVRGNPSQLLTGVESIADDRYVLGVASHQGSLLWHVPGQLYIRRADATYGAGPHWSVIDETTGAMGGSQTRRDQAVNAGDNIVGYTSQLPAAQYQGVTGAYPKHSSAGASVPTCSCVAGDVTFNVEGANLHVYRGFPSTTLTTLATDAVAGVRGVWATKAGVDYLVVYSRTSDTRLLKVSSSGAIISSLTLTGAPFNAAGNTLLSVAYNSQSGIAVVFAAVKLSASCTLAHVTVSSMALGLTENNATPAGELVRDVAIGCNPGLGVDDRWRAVLQLGQGLVALFAFQEAVGGTFNETLSLTTTPLGVAERRDSWGILFPPTSFGGRLVFGVLNFRIQATTPGAYVPLHPATWMVLDTGDLAPVASGDEGDCAISLQGSAASTSGLLRFGVLEADVFDRGTVTRTRAVVKSITPAPAVAATVSGTSYFSGQLPYAFDGIRSFPAGFPLRPQLHATAAALGTLTSGSYSLQATWRFTDAQGNVHRSAPSDKFTLSVPASGQITAVITAPEWLWPVVGREACEVELYMTVPNPGANEGLYLAEAKVCSGSTYQTIVINDPPANPISSLAPLYTNGGVMENNRPVASRGLVASGSRLWCSDGKRLLGSKLVQASQGVAWSYLADDSLTIPLPSSAGAVRALGAIDDNVVVLCEAVTLVLSGQGPPDTGGPSDFLTPREVYRAPGPVTPAGACSLPTGVAWASEGGGIHLLNAGGQGSPIGQGVVGRWNRLAFLPSFAPSAGEPVKPGRLVALQESGDLVGVMLLTTGAWAMYTTANSVVDLAVARDPGDVPTVYYLHGSTGTSVLSRLSPGTNHTQFVVKTHLRDLGLGGRVHSVTPYGRLLGSSGTLTLAVLADQAQAPLTNAKTFSLTVPTTNSPRSELPKWVLPKPRMASFALEITASGEVALTHAVVELQTEQTETRRTR